MDRFDKPVFTRDALCPRCNQPMKLILARDHWFFRCFGRSFHPDLYGILGDESNFKTSKVVDPVTMKIVDNPSF